MRHDNLTFVRPIMRLAATDWRRPASIDAKFKAEDGVSNALRVEAIPVFMNQVNNDFTDSGVDISTNVEIFLKFSFVANSVPQMDVSTGVRESERNCTDSVTVTFEKENGFIQVVRVVKGYVLVCRFRAPKLGRDFDDK